MQTDGSLTEELEGGMDPRYFMSAECVYVSFLHLVWNKDLGMVSFSVSGCAATLGAPSSACLSPPFNPFHDTCPGAVLAAGFWAAQGCGGSSYLYVSGCKHSGRPPSSLILLTAPLDMQLQVKFQ